MKVSRLEAWARSGRHGEEGLFALEAAASGPWTFKAASQRVPENLPLSRHSLTLEGSFPDILENEGS